MLSSLLGGHNHIQRSMYIGVLYVQYIKDLTIVQEYAWDVATLAFLYNQLGDASKLKTKQLVGYLSLLHKIMRL